MFSVAARTACSSSPPPVCHGDAEAALSQRAEPATGMSRARSLPLPVMLALHNLPVVEGAVSMKRLVKSIGQRQGNACQSPAICFPSYFLNDVDHKLTDLANVYCKLVNDQSALVQLIDKQRQKMNIDSWEAWLTFKNPVKTIESGQSLSLDKKFSQFLCLDEQATDQGSLGEVFESMQRANGSMIYSDFSRYEKKQIQCFLEQVWDREALHTVLERHCSIHADQLNARIQTGSFINALGQQVIAKSHVASSYLDIASLYVASYDVIKTILQRGLSGEFNSLCVEHSFPVGVRQASQISLCPTLCSSSFASGRIESNSIVITHMYLEFNR